MPFRQIARNHAAAVLSLLVAAAATVVFVLPPIPQDPAYHVFADQRTLLGVANFWNVVTNLPFALVGWLGLRFLTGKRSDGVPQALRPVYAAFFLGALALGCGSAYYHVQPNNDTLLWDRLPMTVSFMAFFCAVVAETVSPRLGKRLLWPLLAAGALSVIYWHATEAVGRGDLRPYGLVQFLPMLLTPWLLALFPAAAPGRGYWWAVVGLYGASKLAELLDGWLYGLSAGFSGHSLKHLLAAFGMYCFLLALKRRRAFRVEFKRVRG